MPKTPQERIQKPLYEKDLFYSKDGKITYMYSYPSEACISKKVAAAGTQKKILGYFPLGISSNTIKDIYERGYEQGLRQCLRKKSSLTK
jgi:hypothetical protein